MLIYGKRRIVLLIIIIIIDPRNQLVSLDLSHRIFLQYI